MKEPTKHYGRIVRNSRQYKGLTIREGSELCGLSPQSLGGIELGDCDPKLSHVLGIAVAFDIDMGALNDCKPPRPEDVPRLKRRVCQYIVTSQTYTDSNGSRIGYGIAAMEHNGDEVAMLAHVDDISSDKSAVGELARRCTRSRLDPVHLTDVVLDFIES